METFKEKFENIIVNKLAVDKEQITPDAKFRSDLGADSLDMVEMALEFEREFKISVPDRDIKKIKTVADAERFIKNQLNEKKLLGE